ncbi:MAG: hypothetical protein QNJ51_21770 [Calothrix sp. MO_167.B12]|nr:hypothetical protein [Calothrix sp. MO_167.B12]
MNIHNNINNHYLTCPICQNSGKPKLIKTGSGLFTCPYCQERLVVSHSGHYVRDPFAWKQTIFYESLRRQNKSSTSILKDSPLFKRTLLSLVLVVAMLTGMIFATQQRRGDAPPLIPKTDQQEKPQ